VRHPPPGIDDVIAAAARIRGAVLRTPLEAVDWLSDLAGTEVLTKLESHQRTGSFKVRGALNAVGRNRNGGAVVTASAGNHGLGVAFAARAIGCAALVFVPASAPDVKKRRIQRLGARLVEVAGGYDDAHAAASAFALSEGARYLHAFSDPDVVAGQGTVALEILEERPDVRTLVVPLGGGGLAGGCGIVARARAKGTVVVGVQSEVTSAMSRSFHAGRPVSHPPGETVCDGLAGDVDERSLALCGAVVDEIVLVPEREVRRAMRSLFIEAGIVAEGSAAVVAAAIRTGAIGGRAGPIALVSSGGNVDAGRFAEVLSDGAAPRRDAVATSDA
jgi:threonine dehydratase